jgi:hypothetical protein
VKSRTTRVALALVVSISAHNMFAQRAPSAHYESLLQNAHVHVFRLTLPGRTTTPVYLANHDQVWIALADAEFTIHSKSREDQRLRLARGNARFVSHGSIAALTLDSPVAVELIVVIINAREHAVATCDCTGRVAQSICGCGEAGKLPPLWAVALGDVTLAGTTLRPGQTYPQCVERGEMLLVAITPLVLRDRVNVTSAGNSDELTFSPGQVAWMPASRHRFENSTGEAVQFVTLEF